ncbi:MAG: sporulation protein [Peptococcaceae bacterium]|nr:sporulation protein [Peptococcaceae bacterium]
MLATSCGIQNPSAKKQPVNREDIVINHEIAAVAKQKAVAVKGVEEAAAMAIGKELSLAIKVSGLDRFRLQSIREQVHDTVKELDPNNNVFVTTDKKLFVRLQQIEQQGALAQEESLQEIGSEFKEIIKDMGD